MKSIYCTIQNTKIHCLSRFNVRRHQMLYCVRKDQIDPRDLGLGKMEENKEKEEDLGLTGEKTIS